MSGPGPEGRDKGWKHDEIAVDAFLKGTIGFLDIPDLIEKTMNAHTHSPVETIEVVMAADKWARETARRQLSN